VVVGTEQARAFQLVVAIPPAVQKKLGPEELRRILNPIPSLQVDESGTSELERNLEAFARANGISDTFDGKPRLDWVRVTRLFTSPSRERDRLFADEFNRLRTERGLIVMEPTDGTVTSGLASLVIPAGGYSAENPLDVSWTSTWATQATMLVLSIGGGSFPEGAAGSVRYLPYSISSADARRQATPENPIGGANDWSDSDRTVLADWRQRLGNRLPADADLAQGYYLTHSDITGNVVFLFIPSTSVNVDLGNPIPGVQGIPGLTLSGIDDVMIAYHALAYFPSLRIGM